jgi:hypothetical protein
VAQFMRLLSLHVLSFALASCTLYAQQATPPSPASQTVKLPTGSLPVDPEKLTREISDSYYHPDDLGSMDCTMSIDWGAMFTSMKVEPPSDRLKILQGMSVQVHAVRDKSAELKFVWGSDDQSAHDQLEAGAKQMITGFYQMYWSFSSPGMIPTPAQIEHVESRSNGETVVNFNDHGTENSVTVGKDFVPVHYTVDSPTMKATMDPVFLPSPTPVPGDLRRLSSIHLVNQIGTSTFGVDITMEYQTVGGFNIPSRATMGLTGAYTLPLVLTGCSVSKVDAKFHP